MILKVGKSKYNVIEVDKTSIDSDEQGYYGCICYLKREIEILDKLPTVQKRRTLMHELMHAFLFEYALPQQNDITYTFERLCEVASTYADDIVKLADKYFKSKEVDND